VAVDIKSIGTGHLHGILMMIRKIDNIKRVIREKIPGIQMMARKNSETGHGHVIERIKKRNDLLHQGQLCLVTK
jgi:hypothetical protein